MHSNTSQQHTNKTAQTKQRKQTTHKQSNTHFLINALSTQVCVCVCETHVECVSLCMCVCIVCMCFSLSLPRDVYALICVCVRSVFLCVFSGFMLRLLHPLLAPGSRGHPEMPASGHHCAHGDRRQHQHGPCHRCQVWHHPAWRGLPVSRG